MYVHLTMKVPNKHEDKKNVWNAGDCLEGPRAGLSTQMRYFRALQVALPSVSVSFYEGFDGWMDANT